MKLIPAALLTFIPIAAQAQFYPLPEFEEFGSPAAIGDRDDIASLLDTFQSAWASQDAAGVAQLHTRDANWTNAFGRTFRTRESLEAFLREDL